MTTIVDYDCSIKAVRRRERHSMAGRLQNGTYFVSLKLGKNSIDAEVLAREKKVKKVFRAWKEGWRSGIQKERCGHRS